MIDMNIKKSKIGIYAILIIFYIVINSTNSYSQVVPLDEIPTTSQEAKVGIFLMNVYDLDFSSNSFYADFYLWAKWKGEIDPLADIEFVNNVEKWGLTQEYLYDTTQIIEGGYNYNVLRVEGRFFQVFKLDRYPLDKQSFTIQLENAVYNINDLVYLKSGDESGFATELFIPGFRIKDFEINENQNIYQTDFGFTENEEKEIYSNLSFSLNVFRPANFFLWKLMLPLVVVLITSLGATFIFPGYIDARIYLPIGGLLSAVFLQQSYSESLPDIGFMVLMDKIYVLSYVVIIINLIQAIITANMVSSEEDADIQRVNKIDKIFSVVSFLSFATATILIIVTA